MKTKIIKYDPCFIKEVDKYIKICALKKIQYSIKGFAEHIGTDEASVKAWANKRKKDEKGNPTKEFVRLDFLRAVRKLLNLPAVPVKQQKPSKPKEEKLNPKQELFCQLYAADREFFGNGVRTYIEIYKPNQSSPNWHNNARSAASQILTNTNIIRRINELLEEGGLNNSFVDKQLSFLILQHVDFSAKIAAIREYNKLKQRLIERSEMEHSLKIIWREEEPK